jgi:hypothetical protein
VRKTAVEAAELEKMFIAAFQQHAVCQEIDRVTVVKEAGRPETNWRVLSYGRPWHQLDRDCYRHAVKIQERLRERYDVIWPD